MNRNILMDAGVIPIQFVRKAVENSIYSPIFIQHASRIKVMREQWPAIDNFRMEVYENHKETKAVKHPKEVANYYNRVYDSLISDSRTMQIAERVRFRITPAQNNFNDLILISNLVLNWIDLIIDTNPIFLFFHSTPHDLFSWTLGKTAEAMGVDVYMSRTSALPWKSILVRGINEQLPVSVDYEGLSEANMSRVQLYVQQNSQNYDEAIPSYEKNRLDERKGSFWSWKKEIKDIIRKPYRFFPTIKKYRLYKYYQSLATNEVTKDDYIMVFLHYQPERTSLPEGGLFTQQLNLVRTINLALPQYKVYVKEHPSMFVGNFDFRYRNKSFYRELAKMENVKLVDIRKDSFSLLDNSLCIATITGTVGVQALIRGKAVLCFGPARCIGFSGCFKVSDCEEVRKAINSIEKIKYEDEKLSVLAEHYLNALDKHSANGMLEAQCSDFYARQHRLNADGRVLYALLNKVSVI